MCVIRYPVIHKIVQHPNDVKKICSECEIEINSEGICNSCQLYTCEVECAVNILNWVDTHNLPKYMHCSSTNLE